MIIINITLQHAMQLIKGIGIFATNYDFQIPKCF